MGAVIAWLMGTRIGKLLTALVAAAAILIGTFQYGRKAQRDEDRVDDLEDFIKTKERIDNVEASPDRDAAVDRLRHNGWTG